jgi:hypothetical protein
MHMSAVADANRGDFTANPRVLVVTLMAVFIGVASAFVALALTKLSGFFTNLFYYQRIAIGEFTLPAPGAIHLGVWSVFIPVIGGLLIGLMARYYPQSYPQVTLGLVPPNGVRRRLQARVRPLGRK